VGVVCLCLNKGRPYGFHPKGRQTIVISSFLVDVAMQKGCSLHAFRCNFIALVFLVYVTRPVVVTAAVYDEQSFYYFMSPCKGLESPYDHPTQSMQPDQTKGIDIPEHAA
jgi:hypothetical protein